MGILSTLFHLGEEAISKTAHAAREMAGKGWNKIAGPLLETSGRIKDVFEGPKETIARWDYEFAQMAEKLQKHLDAASRWWIFSETRRKKISDFLGLIAKGKEENRVTIEPGTTEEASAHEKFFGSIVNPILDEEQQSNPVSINNFEDINDDTRTISAENLTSSNCVAIRALRQSFGLQMDPDMSAMAEKRASYLSKLDKPDHGLKLLPYRLFPAEKETDGAHANQCLTKKQQRDGLNDQWEECSIILDMETGSYPYHGDPNILLEHIKSRPEFQKAKNAGMNRVGMSIQENGTKVVLTLFMRKDIDSTTPPLQCEPILDTYDDDQWLNAIPQEYREENHPFGINKILKAIRDEETAREQPIIGKGFTVFQYFLLQKNIERLKKKWFPIKIQNVKMEFGQTVMNTKRDCMYLEVVTANRATQKLRLMLGTELIVLPSTVELVGSRTKQKEGEKTEILNQFMPVSRFIQHLVEQCETGSIPEQPRVQQITQPSQQRPRRRLEELEEPEEPEEDLEFSGLA